MSKYERSAFSIIIVLSCLFLVAAAAMYVKRSDDEDLASGQTVHLSSRTVIGYNSPILGNINAPYTLVEFGDYECPPCHVASQEVGLVLKQYRMKVNFVFRNYPLTDIHPNAMRAAQIAEVASMQGKFWQAHDTLYAENVICPASLDWVELTLHINLHKPKHADISVANLKIRTDVDVADKIGITSTPTFILCSPSGTVLRLKSINDVGRFVH